MNKIVKASFKGCTIEQRKIFHKSHCIVPISVDQSLFHEGSKFEATIQLITRRFNKCTILIDDTVQRYTLKILDRNKSLDELYYEALKRGDYWLERNFKYIEAYNSIVDVIRWNKWLFHERFDYQLKIIEWFYIANL